MSEPTSGMRPESAGDLAARGSLDASPPRLRVTYVFEYDPFTYTGENLTPEQLAKRDWEDFRNGDLHWDDLDGWEVITHEIEPVERRT